MSVERRPVKHSRLIAASPIYYGWVVLIAGTLGMLMTTPGQTVGVSVFLYKIITELGLSRSTVSLLYMLGTLTGSFSLPFIGRFIDRKGPRTAVIAIAHYHNARKSYLAGQFAQAMGQFGRILEIDRYDKAASLHLERCNYWLQNPPAEDWDGSWALTEK